MMTESEVLERAMELPATEREAIAHRLLESLVSEPVDADVEQAWAEEIESRCAAYDRGEVDAVDALEFLDTLEQAK